MDTLPIDIVKNIYTFFHPIHDYIHFLNNLVIREKCLCMLSCNKSWYNTYNIKQNHELNDILLEYSIKLKCTVLDIENFLRNNPKLYRLHTYTNENPYHYRTLWVYTIDEFQINCIDNTILEKSRYHNILYLLQNGTKKELLDICNINDILVQDKSYSRKNIAKIIMKKL